MKFIRPRRSRAPNTPLEIEREMFLVPEHVVIDTSRPVNQIGVMFDHSVEFILDGIIEALGDRVNTNTNLHSLVRRLSVILEDSEIYSRHDVIDQLVTIEQSALDMSDYLIEQKMYLYGRYMPYQFETLMDNGALLLKRYEDYQGFCERVYDDLGFDEGE